jgi:hypothetical protein
MSGSSLRCAVLLCFWLGCVGDIERGREQRNVGDAKGQSDDPSAPADENADDADEPDDSSGDDQSSGDDGTSVGEDPGGDETTGEGDDVSEPGEGSGDDNGPDGEVDSDQLEWRSANVTNFESYPADGTSECIDFSGCDYRGQFAGVEGTQPLQWVMSNNIAAVHSRDFEAYAHKTLRLRDGQSEIDVVVYDLCSDDDCEDRLLDRPRDPHGRALRHLPRRGGVGLRGLLSTQLRGKRAEAAPDSHRPRKRARTWSGARPLRCTRRARPFRPGTSSARRGRRARAP